MHPSGPLVAAAGRRALRAPCGFLAPAPCQTSGNPTNAFSPAYPEEIATLRSSAGPLSAAPVMRRARGVAWIAASQGRSPGARAVSSSRSWASDAKNNAVSDDCNAQGDHRTSPGAFVPLRAMWVCADAPLSQISHLLPPPTRLRSGHRRRGSDGLNSGRAPRPGDGAHHNFPPSQHCPTHNRRYTSDCISPRAYNRVPLVIASLRWASARLSSSGARAPTSTPAPTTSTTARWRYSGTFPAWNLPSAPRARPCHTGGGFCTPRGRSRDQSSPTSTTSRKRSIPATTPSVRRTWRTCRSRGWWRCWGRGWQGILGGAREGRWSGGGGWR